MGRVKRYKKIKACDPFAKRGAIDSKGGSSYDQPPDLFEQKKREKRKKERSMDNDDDREILMQREALRAIRLTKTHVKGTDKVEGKKVDETMKEFKDRVRDQTKVTLIEELSKLTSTAKKRKERLKERKVKRKLKKSSKSNNGSDGNSDEETEFFEAANGRLRPSDLGGASSFKGIDTRFGDRNDRPPELMIKPKMKRKQNDSQSSNSSNSSDAVDNEKKQKKSLEAIWDGGDDIGSTTKTAAVAAADGRSNHGGIIYNGTGGAKATASEMEQLRLKAMAAYKQLREKRLEAIKNKHY